MPVAAPAQPAGPQDQRIKVCSTEPVHLPQIGQSSLALSNWIRWVSVVGPWNTGWNAYVGHVLDCRRSSLRHKNGCVFPTWLRHIMGGQLEVSTGPSGWYRRCSGGRYRVAAPCQQRRGIAAKRQEMRPGCFWRPTSPARRGFGGHRRVHPRADRGGLQVSSARCASMCCALGSAVGAGQRPPPHASVLD